VLLVVGVLALVTGFNAYSKIDEVEASVHYEFPSSDLYIGYGYNMHYNTAGFYSMLYPSAEQETIRIKEYKPPQGFQGNLYDVHIVFLNSSGGIEGITSLLEYDKYHFSSDYTGEIRIYLATPRSLSDMQREGYYGEWAVTFIEERYGRGHWFFTVIALLFFASAGIVGFVKRKRGKMLLL